MDFGIRGRVALVNGASSGIGLGVARALAAEGADLVLCAHGAAKLAAAAQAIALEHGVQVLPVAADVAQEGAAAAVVRQAMNAFGRLDILVTTPEGRREGSHRGLPLRSEMWW